MSSSDDRDAGSAEMHINGLGSVPNLSSSSKPPAANPSESSKTSETNRPADQVEISAEAQPADGESAPGVRARRLAQIKQAIDAGEYETPDKLEAALSRLFAELNLDDEDE